MATTTLTVGVLLPLNLRTTLAWVLITDYDYDYRDSHRGLKVNYGQAAILANQYLFHARPVFFVIGLDSNQAHFDC